MTLTRLDKFITESGAATRSEARRLIGTGRVWVNGSPAMKADLKLDGETDTVTLDGRPLTGGFCYLMLHKPLDVVSATEDRDEKTVIDLLPEAFRRLRLFPVGRLDKDATGLLLLTNDGDFAHAITAPRREIPKRYEFWTETPPAPEAVSAFAQGVTLADGSLCLPAVLEPDPQEPCHGYLTIREGKYHQVKRMLASVGAPVRQLKRLSIGGLSLDPSLEPGKLRKLSEIERSQIFHENVTE